MNVGYRSALIIFAKEPILGEVKTRLYPQFSFKDCCFLYRAFVKDTLLLSDQIQKAQSILFYSSDKPPEFLTQIAAQRQLIEQSKGNLGDRLYHAFCWAKEKGFSKTVIMGTDSPTLPIQYIEEAFEQLNQYDVVLGPAEDGGYYLIGMKEPIKGVFQNIPWSTDQVLTHTRDNVAQAQKSCMLLKKWYDVDDINSIEKLKKDLKAGIGFYTQKFFDSLGGKN